MSDSLFIEISPQDQSLKETETLLNSSGRNSNAIDNKKAIKLFNLKKIKTHDEDAQYEFKYHFKYFLIALAIHLIHTFIGPISIPAIYKIFGSNLCKNMYFKRSFHYLFEFATHICTILNIIFCIVYPDLASKWIGLVVSALSIIALKTSLITIKYGYYSEKKWNLMQKETLDNDVLNSEYLMKSWLIIPEDVIDSELDKSFKRLDKSPNQLCFTFEAEINEDCHKFLADLKSNLGIEIIHEFGTHTNNNQCYPLIVFARVLIKKADSKIHFRGEILVIVLIGMVYCLLPFITIWWIYGVFDGNDLNAIFISLAITNTLESWFEGWRLLMFVYIGMCDFRRRNILLNECTAMISDIDLKDTVWYDREFPSGNMYDLKTIESWYVFRVAALDFGRKYTYRIFAYSSLALPSSVFMIALLLLQAFGVLGGASSGAFISVMYLTIVGLSLITFMVFSGISLNRAFSLHRDLILNIIGHIMKNIDHKKQNEEMLMIAKWLKYLVQKLEQDELLRPVMIMGIKLDSSLLTKIATLLVSGLIAIAQMLLKN